MTIEEAIEELKEEFEVFKNGISSTDWENPNKELKKIIEANTMAIKALEQQHCNDCISRNELLARIDEERKHLLDIKMDGAEHVIVHHARRIIEDMPSLTPQQTRWIPCSERLPESDEEYHTFLVTDSKGRVTLSEFYLSISDRKPYWSGMVDVIAWMPLPKPYKAESEDKK